MSTKYWERRELHDRHAKALDKASASFREKVAARISEIAYKAVDAYKEGRK